jgi:hypothetical protein
MFRESQLSNNVLRRAIQKVATGPEFSKNISEEDSYNSMLNILDNESDSIQAGDLFNSNENEKRNNGRKHRIS